MVDEERSAYIPLVVAYDVRSALQNGRYVVEGE